MAKRVSPARRTVPAVTRRYALAALGGIMVPAIAAWLGWRHWDALVAFASVDLSQWVRIRDSGQEGSVAGLAVVTAMDGDNQKLVGGHAVMIVGFDPGDSSIKFANSWGVSWGAGGDGKMSARGAQRMLIAMGAIDVPFGL